MERNRAINLPPAVLWLAVVFIGVHVARQLVDAATDEWVLYAFSFIPARYDPIGAELPGGIAARLWSPLTHAFLHADALHLFVNIIWMAGFGAALARRFGSVRFLALSAISAIGGAAVFYVLHRNDASVVIGASGAVSGMMAATARFAFSPNGPLAGGRGGAAFNVPAEPLRAAFSNRRVVVFVLVWFAVNFLFGFAGGLVAGVSGPIAWEAHVGGFLAGLLAFPLLDPVRGGDEPGEKLAS